MFINQIININQYKYLLALKQLLGHKQILILGTELTKLIVSNK